MDEVVKTSINNMEEEHEAGVYALLLSCTHIFPMVLNTAVELNLFEIIAAAGPGAKISAFDLASKLPTRYPHAPSALDRMLHLLATYSLLNCTLHTFDDGRVERFYGLASASKFFLKDQDHEGSLASYVLFTSHPASRKIWEPSKEAILEGGDVFKKDHGMSMFQYMEAHPILNKAFNKALGDESTIIMKKVVEVYKGFEGLTSLVDVGGGNGASLNMIISKYPSIKGINFDLPHVVQNSPSYPGIEHVGGDMFLNIPKGDAILIKNTCHNWSDEYCLKLLKNCYQVLPKNGKVIVMEFVMPAAPGSSDAAKFVSLVDYLMSFTVGGKERTEKEFEALCKGSGFSGFRVACRAYTVWVMEFFK